MNNLKMLFNCIFLLSVVTAFRLTPIQKYLPQNKVVMNSASSSFNPFTDWYTSLTKSSSSLSPKVNSENVDAVVVGSGISGETSIQLISFVKYIFILYKYIVKVQQLHSIYLKMVLMLF